MIAADTSVTVAALLGWHEAHDASRTAFRGASIPAHALTETYSVLTRLPRPLSPGDAARLLEGTFDDARVLVPSPELLRTLPSTCARHGIAGGAVYDAVVALTAAEHEATLLTRDRRAARVYDKIGVDVAWVR